MKCEKMVVIGTKKKRMKEKHWIHTFMEGSFELLNVRESTIAHIM
jgi:hypothetical protein